MFGEWKTEEWSEVLNGGQKKVHLACFISVLGLFFPSIFPPVFSSLVISPAGLFSLGHFPVRYFPHFVFPTPIISTLVFPF